ncbi:MAG: hypothetical protein K1060chlam3_00126 [Candidatus Anoxychlamydiales bacterium]|nr:hypothetical protein [Candidatus Anoxychlamydiales bacterium]
MRTKRISGIIIVLIGVALILSSFYIRSRVRSGRQEISEAQSTVSKGKKLFSVTPITKEVGKGFMNSVQKKINEATGKADSYAVLATWFQIGGSVFIVLGAVLIYIGRKK